MPMTTHPFSRFLSRGVTLATGALMLGLAPSALAQYAENGPQIGADNNSAENPFVQPQDPALSGGGIDQSLQFGDILLGTSGDDLQIGRLGIDVLWAGYGNDLMIGGTEHFNPFNRDRAFGRQGHDIFIWAPGDGSDFFDGGKGTDALVFGLLGEVQEGETVFDVENDQQAGDIFLDPVDGLPRVDATNSPGFCTVIDASSSPDAAAELEALGLDHLVRFSIRGVADAFEAGEQNEDNGLRVTLHLKDVEYVVCTAREGGAIEVLDLTTSPPMLTSIDAIPSRVVRERLQTIVQ